MGSQVDAVGEKAARCLVRWVVFKLNHVRGWVEKVKSKHERHHPFIDIRFLCKYTVRDKPSEFHQDRLNGWLHVCLALTLPRVYRAMFSKG